MKKTHIKILEKFLKRECHDQKKEYNRSMLQRAKKAYWNDPKVREAVIKALS